MKTHVVLPVVAALLALVARHASAYGPEGHYAVGYIAEARLEGTPTGAKVRELLDGIPLGMAATIPDRIKSWDNDKTGGNDAKGYKMPQHPKVEADLRAFWLANKPGQNDDEHPSHHTFHYTDVPLDGHEKYADGTAGRSRWDIVHMIPYCCRVLSGEIPEKNERAINKTVAVILLAHYVGDIHQPLHVGAEYFNNGKIVNPGKDPSAMEDQGGNTFTLALVDPPGVDPTAPRRRPKLHGFWDSNAVKFLIEQVTAEVKQKNPAHGPEITLDEFDRYLANAPEPADWRPAAGLPFKDWAESWANDILPIAREAHARLEFTELKADTDYGRPLIRGVAVERPGQTPPYANWATNIVHAELIKGGWRLALMLQKAIPLPPGTPVAPLTPPNPAAALSPASVAAASPAAEANENESPAKADE